ncbi:MAG: dephospho-CoA kinase [Chloroflexi bacterium]|nr:dephospho-CoA kinase [Chloroflexota bacterium]
MPGRLRRQTSAARLTLSAAGPAFDPRDGVCYNRRVIQLIGITGNLGAGKSSVLGMLAELGAYTIDADQLTRELMVPGTSVYQQVIEVFGPAILNPDGSIDRRGLGRRVFGDPQALARLESIVHPAVMERIEGLIAAAPRPVVAIEAVKLVEAGLHRRCDVLWVVIADPQIVRARLSAQGDLSQDEIDARLAAQASIAEKVKLADVVIDNSGTEEETRAQVVRAWEHILTRAQAPWTSGTRGYRDE